MFVGLETFQSFPRLFNMSQLFPKSILLHFPSEIYLRRGGIVPPVSPCFARKRDCRHAVPPGGSRTGHRAL